MNKLFIFINIILILIFLKFIINKNDYEKFQNKLLSTDDEFDEQYVFLYDFLFNIDEINLNIIDLIETDIIKKYKNKVNIIDAGSGTGYYSNILQKRGYDITGIDKSISMIQYSEFNNVLVKYILADLTNINILPLNSYSHLILNNECFYSNTIDNMKKILFNSYKWLKDDGILIFFLINNENLDPSPRDYSQYYVDNLSNRHSFTYFKGFSHNAWFMKDNNREFGYNYYQKIIIEKSNNKRIIISKYTIPPREYILNLLINSGFYYNKSLNINNYNDFEIIILKKKL